MAASGKAAFGHGAFPITVGMRNIFRLSRARRASQLANVTVELTAQITAGGEEYLCRRSCDWPSVPQEGQAVAMYEGQSFPVGELTVLSVRYRSNGVAMVRLGAADGGPGEVASSWNVPPEDILEDLADAGWHVDELLLLRNDLP